MPHSTTPLAPARRLVLVRHGRTDWNSAGRIQGQSESVLDEVGHAQAARVAAVLAEQRPAVIWSSDSVRARETAAYLADAAHVTVRHDARLREYYLAERQGITHEEYLALAPEEYAAFRLGDFDAVPGGERSAQVAARVVAALTELMASIEPGEVAVAVSHGAAIRDSIPVLLGWPVTARAPLHGLANGGWAELDQTELGGPMRLVAYNRHVEI